eukprot:821956-Karenia_brevis.AAC.1
MIGMITEKQRDVVDIQHVHPKTGKHSKISYIYCRNPAVAIQLLTKFQAKFGRNYYALSATFSGAIWLARFETIDKLERKKVLRTCVGLLRIAWNEHVEEKKQIKGKN